MLIPAGAKGFDSDTRISAAVAAQFKSLGYDFAVRYVGRFVTQSRGDLDASELQGILAGGLGVMIVQHASGGFVGSAALGQQWGQAAVVNARAAGYARGCALWCDFENCRQEAGSIDYLNAWARTVRAGGYIDGLYYGADSPLSADQLYHSLITARYWRAGSRLAPIIPHRGACMQQSLSTVVAGISIDEDIVHSDAFGSRPVMMTSGARMAATPQTDRLTELLDEARAIVEGMKGPSA